MLFTCYYKLDPYQFDESISNFRGVWCSFCLACCILDRFCFGLRLIQRQTSQLLKATCSPNPNPRTICPGLASHLVLPNEPIHSLYLLHLMFFYNIIKNNNIYSYIYIYTNKHNGFTLLKSLHNTVLQLI